MITRELKVKIRQSEVFHQIDCYEDSDLYEEVLEEYREIEEQMYALCEPVFLMEYGTVGPELAREGIAENTPVLMVITSIGKGISEYSTKCLCSLSLPVTPLLITTPPWGNPLCFSFNSSNEIKCTVVS